MLQIVDVSNQEQQGDQRTETEREREEVLTTTRPYRTDAGTSNKIIKKKKEM